MWAKGTDTLKGGNTLAVVLENAVRIQSLVDSGAGKSALSKEVLEKLNAIEGRKPITLHPVTVKLSCANGQALPVAGMAVVQLDIGGQTVDLEVCVIENLTIPLVLGCDFLHKTKASLNLSQARITFGNGISMHLGPEATLTAKVKIKNKQHITIPANSEAIILGLLVADSLVPNESLAIVEPDGWLPQRYGLAGAAAVVKVRDKTVPCRIINTSNSKVRLPRGAHLAQVSLVDEDAPMWPAVEPLEENMATDLQTLAPEVLDQVPSVPEELTPDLSESDLKESEKEELNDLIKRYRDVFAVNMSELGTAAGIEADIQVDSSKIINQRQYNIPQALRPIMQKQLDNMLEAGLIKRSQSEYNSPILLIPKQTAGEYRLCVDLREINKIVRPEHFPQPSCDEVLSGLHGSRLFSVCDLSSGYDQIKLKASCTKYFAFSSFRDHYELLRLPQGLISSPAIFSRIMHRIFLGQESLVCYLDDLIVTGKDWRGFRHY